MAARTVGVLSSKGPGQVVGIAGVSGVHMLSCRHIHVGKDLDQWQGLGATGCMSSYSYRTHVAVKASAGSCTVAGPRDRSQCQQHLNLK